MVSEVTTLTKSLKVMHLLKKIEGTGKRTIEGMDGS